MKKIILVGNTAWSMVRFRKGLIERLISLGYNVTIIAPSDEHESEIRKLGCNYIDIKIDNKGWNPLKDLGLILKLRAVYKKLNPDLIMHYTIKPNIYGTIAARLVNIKSIGVVTGLGYTFIHDTLVSKIAKFLYKFSFQYSQKVFFINEDDKNEFLINGLVKKDKIVIIPGEGVNTSLFSTQGKNGDSNQFKFLLVARMLWDKGIGEYVEASKIIKKKYNNIEFGLLGYLAVENPQAITQGQMDIWTNEGNIKFYGSTNDVKSSIFESSCVVLPSYREGVSMALMEAASMKKPLIATNVTGCRDLIDNKVNGYLCKVRDAIDLADKMEAMLNLSKEERITMGEAGRIKMINQYDDKIVINKYLKVILNVL